MSSSGPALQGYALVQLLVQATVPALRDGGVAHPDCGAGVPLKTQLDDHIVGILLRARATALLVCHHRPTAIHHNCSRLRLPRLVADGVWVHRLGATVLRVVVGELHVGQRGLELVYVARPFLGVL